MSPRLGANPALAPAPVVLGILRQLCESPIPAHASVVPASRRQLCESAASVLVPSSRPAAVSCANPQPWARPSSPSPPYFRGSRCRHYSGSGTGKANRLSIQPDAAPRRFGGLTGQLLSLSSSIVLQPSVQSAKTCQNMTLPSSTIAFQAAGISILFSGTSPRLPL